MMTGMSPSIAGPSIDVEQVEEKKHFPLHYYVDTSRKQKRPELRGILALAKLFHGKSIKSKMKSIHLQLAEMRVVNAEKSSRRAASDKLRLLLSHHSCDSFNRTINFMLLWPHK